MARPKLAECATVRDVSGTLDKPVDYVRGVLGNMHSYRKDHGSALVRIGITGRGIVPHYRLEPSAELDDAVNDYVEGGEAWLRHFVAFHGRNHKRLDWGAEELKGAHWSRGFMDFEAVQQLIGEMRGIRPNGVVNA